MDFIGGFALGAGLITIIILLLVFNSPANLSRQKCEENLPRSQKCVSIWVPEVKGEK